MEAECGDAGLTEPVVGFHLGPRPRAVVSTFFIYSVNTPLRAPPLHAACQSPGRSEDKRGLSPAFLVSQGGDCDQKPEPREEVREAANAVLVGKAAAGGSVSWGCCDKGPHAVRGRGCKQWRFIVFQLWRPEVCSPGVSGALPPPQASSLLPAPGAPRAPGPVACGLWPCPFVDCRWGHMGLSLCLSFSYQVIISN